LPLLDRSSLRIRPEIEKKMAPVVVSVNKDARIVNKLDSKST
jgi:hypothetical protein